MMHNVAMESGSSDGIGWTLDSEYATSTFPAIANTNAGGLDEGVRIADINGDGLPDMIESFDHGPSTTKNMYIKDNEKADLLARVTSSAGAQTNITYKGRGTTI
jgi:hypothetical protein